MPPSPGGVSFPNGKPWLVVGEKGYTVSNPAGTIVEKGVARQEPLTLEVTECLTVRFTSAGTPFTGRTGPGAGHRRK